MQVATSGVKRVKFLDWRMQETGSAGGEKRGRRSVIILVEQSMIEVRLKR